MNYIKEAEKNVVSIAKSFNDMYSIIDAMQRFGNLYCHESIGKKEYFEGLQKVRDAIHHEFAEAIKNCFLFIGVGGKNCEEYSKEMFLKHFGEDRYVIINFLDKFGQIPSSWNSEIDEDFRKECESKVKDMKKE